MKSAFVRYIKCDKGASAIEAAIALPVFIIFIFGIMFFAGINTSIDYKSVFKASMMVAALSLGIGTLNCLLNVMFPIWVRVWAIFNRPLLIVSCVIFPFHSVPEFYRNILWFNPLVHSIGALRGGLYPTYDAYYVSGLYVYGVSGVCFLIAVLVLNRCYKDILNA